MARIPTSSKELSFYRWYAANRQPRPQMKPAPKMRSELQAFVNYMWPLSLPYASPIDHVFVSGLANLKQLEANRVWIARDGLVPLLWFFTKFPKPGSFRGRLLVHENVAPYVPHEWRHRCGSYRMESTGAAPPSKKGLIVTGLVMDSQCSMEYLEQTLKSIPRLRKEAGPETLLFLPTRHGGNGDEFNHDFFPEFILRLSEALSANGSDKTSAGPKLACLNWTQLVSKHSLVGYTLVELNEGYLWSDSYVSHLLLGKGARLPSQGRETSEKMSKLIPLSPYHGMRINLDIGKWRPLNGAANAMDWKDVDRFYKAHQSTANRRFPWPEWFGSWVRSPRP